MLLPALQGAKEKGKRAICMNNLRQCGLSLQLYAEDDVKQRLPGGQWDTAFVITSGKPLLTKTYGMNYRVVTCPSAYKETSGWYVPPSEYYFDTMNGQAVYYGGAMNYCYLGGYGNYGGLSDDAEGWPGGFSFDADRQHYLSQCSAKKPLMWDISYAPPYVNSHYVSQPPRSNHANPDGTAYGENMLFGDMHVEWRPLNHGIGKDGDGTLGGSHFFGDYYVVYYK